MKLRSLLLILSFFFTTCHHSKQTTKNDSYEEEFFSSREGITYYPIKNNKISVDLDNPQKASLYDYFKHIELIPLETNDNVLIGRLMKILVYKNMFYTFDAHQNSVYIFNDTGKFVSKISKRGIGPGEYLSLNDISINTFCDNIDFLNSSGYIYSYDLSGNHIKTVYIADSVLLAVHNLISISESVYVFYAMFLEDHIIYYNLDENKILNKKYNECAFASVFNNSSPFYEYNEQIFFYRYFDNVTYELRDGTLVKAYKWDFGRNEYDVNKMYFSKEDFRNIKTLIEAANSRIPYSINLQGQNNRYIFVHLYFQFNLNRNLIPTGNLIFDKLNQECKFIKDFEEGISFRPEVVTNEYVLSYCTHEELEKYVKKEMLDKDNLQKFEKLLNTQEEENPIIIKYFLK